MENNAENEIKCWNCENEIEKKDRYCKYCGKEQKSNNLYYFEYLNTNCWKCNAKIERKDKHCKECGAGQNEGARFQYTEVGIMVQFLLKGPFVLYNLFKSPIIEAKSKKVLGAIIIGISIAVIMGLLYLLSELATYYMNMLKI